MSQFQIAPVIHEWTYDAMCHDLLDMDGNKYVYEVLIAHLDKLFYLMSLPTNFTFGKHNIYFRFLAKVEVNLKRRRPFLRIKIQSG